MKFILKLLLSKHTRHQVFGSTYDSKSFWTFIQPKNAILTNLLSNCDVARQKPKFDFWAKIMTFEANYEFMNETTVDSLLFGHMGRV
jgi:hypothetical protein